MTALVDFLRRELAPTPGRAHATFRLTLACLIVTIPILTHRIPLALVAMVVMYLVTQEDTAATLVGSILGAAGVTLGLGGALLVWMVVLDIAWLRIVCFVAFVFVGLFLKRVLTMGALGSAIGLPAALVMILPDVAPLPPEQLVEFVLWLWLCVTLGLTVNLGVQLALAPGDPLTLLARELDTRLRTVEEALRQLGGAADISPAAPALSLDALAAAGMSRPLALLKTAALTNSRARQRRETLAAAITLVDRLVTDAGALRLLISPTSGASVGESLVHAADACARTRQALAARFEAARTDTALPGSFDVSGSAPPPLADMAHTLEQLAVVLRVGATSATTKETGPRLFLPDATTNPEYVQFAIKGSVAALICYLCFVGFDYPGIYTSVITCFVVSLSTIGSSNQKGLLRFGGAAVGGVMGLVALVYLFPHVEGLGGFWLVFGTGTAVAAWINFGSPRISYGGYQTGVAFYKATLQGFGTAVSATVVRDRLIGVAFGLIVFGLVEHVLWPVRAIDRMHARLADVWHSLAVLARGASRPGDDDARVTAQRNLIAQQVADVQGFIESLKFEPGAGAIDAQAVQRLIADAQTVFLVLLAIAHDAESATIRQAALREAMWRVDEDVAAILEGFATHARPGEAMPAISLDASVDTLEPSIAMDANATAGDTTCVGIIALYRQLAVVVNRLTESAVPAIPGAAPSPVAPQAA